MTPERIKELLPIIKDYLDKNEPIKKAPTPVVSCSLISIEWETVKMLVDEVERLQAENKTLRELVKEAIPTISGYQVTWLGDTRQQWLEKAKEAVGE